MELEEKVMKFKHDYYQRQALIGYQSPVESSDKFELSGKKKSPLNFLFHKTVL